MTWSREVAIRLQIEGHTVSRGHHRVSGKEPHATLNRQNAGQVHMRRASAKRELVGARHEGPDNPRPPDSEDKVGIARLEMNSGVQTPDWGTARRMQHPRENSPTRWRSSRSRGYSPSTT